MPESRKMAGKGTTTSGLRFGRYEACWGAWDITGGGGGGGGGRGNHTTNRSPGGERRRKKKRSTIFIGRTRKGHRQSDEHWNYSHTNARTYTCTCTHAPSPPPKRDTHARLMDNQISRNGYYCNMKFPSSQIQNRLTCDTIQNFQVVQQTGCPKKTRLTRMTKGMEISTWNPSPK